jgi:hypothetical protein
MDGMQRREARSGHYHKLPHFERRLGALLPPASRFPGQSHGHRSMAGDRIVCVRRAAPFASIRSRTFADRAPSSLHRPTDADTKPVPPDHTVVVACNAMALFELAVIQAGYSTVDVGLHANAIPASCVPSHITYFQQSYHFHDDMFRRQRSHRCQIRWYQ